MRKVKPVIRTLNPNQKEDYWAAVEIIDQALSPRCPQVTQLYSKLGNVPRTYVALNGNRVIGGLIWSYFQKQRQVILNFMAVKPELRDAGIGTLLIGAFEEKVRECKERGADLRAILLDASRENYFFYRKKGFFPVEESLREVSASENLPYGPIEMKKDIL